jgi:K+-sensing histidine kinase KdpD
MNLNASSEKDYYKAFNAVLEECTSLIIQSNEDNFSERINLILQKIGTFSGVDRAYFFDLNHEARTCSNTHEWCKPGVEPQIEYLQDVSFDLVPKWMDKMTTGEEIYIDDLSALDETWDSEKAVLEPQGIQSLLSLPVRESEHFYGFIGFDAVEFKVQWPDDFRHLLSILANNIGSVIRRNLQNKELQNKLDELTQLHNQNKTFISVINHDVFAPIKHINIAGSRLLRNPENLTSEELIEQMTLIINSTKRMELLCSNILRTLKSEDGLVLHREKTTSCMHHILTDLNEYIFISLMVNNNTLQSEINGSSALYINRNVINTVLTNLVNNANRFTKNGHIKITCNFQTAMKHITVEDNGKGMSPATLAKLRSGKIIIGNRDNPELAGYGIGYSLIFRMLEAVDGKIDIQSEQGKGSKITFSWSEAE